MLHMQSYRQSFLRIEVEKIHLQNRTDKALSYSIFSNYFLFTLDPNIQDTAAEADTVPHSLFSLMVEIRKLLHCWHRVVGCKLKDSFLDGI